MELDVGREEQAVMENVETVEVVASGVDIPVSTSTVVGGVGLMDHQHMIVTSPEGILVPTSEVSGVHETHGRSISNVNVNDQEFDRCVCHV